MKKLILIALAAIMMFTSSAHALENIENYYDLSTIDLTTHADDGDPYARYILAERYKYGYANTEVDEVAAEALFKLAHNGFNIRAKLGDAPSMLFLGLMHEQGHGLPESDAKALEYFAKAANKGEPQAYDMVKRLFKADTSAACEWIAQNTKQPEADKSCN